LAEIHRIDVEIAAHDNCSKVLDNLINRLGMSTKSGLALGIAFSATNMAINKLMEGFQYLQQWVSESAEQFRAYEKAVTGVYSIIDRASISFSQLSHTILGFSIIFGESATVLASGLNSIMREVQNISDGFNVLVNSERLAVATGSDLQSSINTVLGVMQSYNMTADQSGEISELLAKVYTRTGTSMEEISSMIARVAPVSQKAGVSLNELAAVFTTLSSKGLPLRQSVSGYQEILENLVNPSEEQYKIMVEMGIAYDDLIVKAEGFTTVLTHMLSATKNNTDAMRTLVGSQQGYNIALALSTGKEYGDNISYFTSKISELNNMYNIMSNTSDFAKRKQEAFGQAVSQGVGEAGSGIENFVNNVVNGFKVMISNFGIMRLAVKDVISNLAPALVEANNALSTETVSAYVNYFSELNDYTQEQVVLLGQLQARQALYNEELTQLQSQRDILVSTHDYTEALHYIPLALDDASYSTKIFDETTRALVDSIRIQRQEIKDLDKANQVLSLGEQKNSLQMMQIQLSSMNHRGRMTREQKRQMEELEKKNLELRIKEMENNIAISEIHQNGLDEEEERLERIERDYEESIRVIEDAYNRELAALDLNIKGKELLIEEYQTAVDTVNTNIINAQNLFWTEYNNIETTNQLDDLTKTQIYMDDKLKIVVEGMKKVKDAMEGETVTTSGRTTTSVGGAVVSVTPISTPEEAAENLRGSPIGRIVFGTYQHGTNYVPTTAPYLLHKGEAVIPANKNKPTNIKITLDPITINANIYDKIDVEKLCQKIEIGVQSGLLKGMTTIYK